MSANRCCVLAAHRLARDCPRHAVSGPTRNNTIFLDTRTQRAPYLADDIVALSESEVGGAVCIVCIASSLACSGRSLANAERCTPPDVVSTLPTAKWRASCCVEHKPCEEATAPLP